MQTKFRPLDRMYFPMWQKQFAESISLCPVEIDSATGMVTAFVDKTTVNDNKESILAANMHQLADCVARTRK